MRRTITGLSFNKTLLKILGIFILFSLLSTWVLYKNLHIPLGPHYAAAHYSIAQLKDSLILKTIIINLGFFVFTAVGVSLLGIFYSHRIAGPLFKVKQYARILGGGAFNERICFRKKDAIHTLATELNEMAQSCQDRTDLFVSKLKELEEGIRLLNSLPDESKEKTELIRRIQALDSSIRKDCKEIQL